MGLLAGCWYTTHWRTPQQVLNVGNRGSSTKIRDMLFHYTNICHRDIPLHTQPSMKILDNQQMGFGNPTGETYHTSCFLSPNKRYPMAFDDNSRNNCGCFRGAKNHCINQRSLQTFDETSGHQRIPHLHNLAFRCPICDPMQVKKDFIISPTTFLIGKDAQSIILRDQLGTNATQSTVGIDLWWN